MLSPLIFFQKTRINLNNSAEVCIETKMICPDRLVKLLMKWMNKNAGVNVGAHSIRPRPLGGDGVNNLSNSTSIDQV
jgi:hypothetical protein